MRKNKVHFHSLYGRFYFPNRKKVKEFLLKLFRKEGYNLESLNIIFCKDDYLLRINKLYLDHDNYTDILTFPLHTEDKPVSSDIFISIDRIKENAKVFHTSFIKELHRVIFHGALHLCGYKDKTKGESEL